MDVGMILEECHIANWTSLINFGQKTHAAICWEGRLQNHCNTDPLTPKLMLRWFNNTPWSTVTNAALKSSKIRRVIRWGSKSIRMSFCTFKSAVSVLWHSWYADWNGGYKPCDVKCACVWSKTAHSINFETYCKLDTGLKLVKSESTLDFLSRGETNASFQQSGNSSDEREQLLWSCGYSKEKVHSLKW